MKVYIRFDFPDDEQAHQYALDGRKYARAIETVLEQMRQMIKYGTDKAGPKHAEYWREQMHNALAEENIVLP
jgi:predicted lipoprotein